MPKLDAIQVADLLLEIGRRASLEGGNPYKAKAYIRAAESLRTLVTPLADVIRHSHLRAIPGIGDAIARRIVELRDKGTDEGLERMRAKYPAPVLELLMIPGLKPTAILKLYTLGVTNLADAEQAAREGRLRKIKGLGASAERKIIEGAGLLRSTAGYLRANRAEELLEHAAEALKQRGLEDSIISGDFRRGCELVSELRLIGTSATAEKAIQERLGTVTVDVVPPAKRGAALLYATGNTKHLAELEFVAESKNLVLSAGGIGKPGGGPLIGDSEAAIYKRLGLPFIPPELREGNGEIERAKSRRLPKLVETADLRGVLHVHTEYSDGVNTVREMAEAARGLGYDYLGISDHSQSAHYAGGLSIDDVQRQHDEIDALNQEFGGSFRILKGIESDILADGALDYPDEVLSTFDFVVASVHSGFRRNKAEQTARLINAVSSPFTTILGHVTGRLLLRRPGYDVDLEQVLKACAECGVAVEINCNPNRLELDWRWHRRAIDLGCRVSINPDAHSIRELKLVRWGIAIARKGWVEKRNVLNAMTAEQFLQYLERRWRLEAAASVATADR